MALPGHQVTPQIEYSCRWLLSVYCIAAVGLLYINNVVFLCIDRPCLIVYMVGSRYSALLVKCLQSVLLQCSVVFSFKCPLYIVRSTVYTQYTVIGQRPAVGRQLSWAWKPYVYKLGYSLDDIPCLCWLQSFLHHVHTVGALKMAYNPWCLLAILAFKELTV